MNNSPQLSVIIPTYNRAALLGMTIESVLKQTFSDYEIIVVDDGSTDCTEDAISQFLKERPTLGKRVRYFFQRNQGKSVALNRGLSEAKGEWIAFLDSDDLWLPNKIEEQFRALQTYGPESQACFTNARYINNPDFQGTVFEHAGRRYPAATGVLKEPIEFIANPFGIFMQTILLHSKTMAKVGEFDPAFWTGQDEDFVFRLSLHAELCYVNMPLVLIDRTPRRQERLTEVRLSREYESLKLKQQMLEKWLRLSEEFTDVQTAIRGHLRGAHSEQSNWLLINKRYGEARRAAAMAARIQCKPGILAKWCLAAMAPALARRLVTRRSLHGNTQELHAALLHSDAKEGIPISVPKGPA